MAKLTLTDLESEVEIEPWGGFVRLTAACQGGVTMRIVIETSDARVIAEALLRVASEVEAKLSEFDDAE